MPVVRRPRVGYVAFWNYASFPYLLGGTITKFKPSKESETGFVVQTTEFGPGRWYAPRFVLPAPEGVELREALKLLKREHEFAHEIVDEGFEVRRVELERSFGVRAGGKS